MNVQINGGLKALLQTMHQLWRAVPVKLDDELIQISFPVSSLFHPPLPMDQLVATNVMSASLQVAGYVAAGEGCQITLVNLNLDYFTGALQTQELVTETDIVFQSDTLIRCQCHLYGAQNRLLGRGISIFSAENHLLR